MCHKKKKAFDFSNAWDIILDWMVILLKGSLLYGRSKFVLIC